MITKAKLADAKNIYRLVNAFAKKKAMLPRSLNYIYENIRDFWVYKKDGKVIGCCALHIIGWDGLAEIKCLSVKKTAQKDGVGKKLAQKCLSEAKKLDVQNVFALTYVPDFFKKLGFKVVSKDALPHKIWSECIDCPFFPDCNEIAVFRNI
jgi:amino-acid N-acetyltransferase